MRFRTIGQCGEVMHQEGGNEHTAWLLLSHLMRIGTVRRFKFQPFNYADYGGPKGFPDLLIELHNSDLIVIEVKSAKYITAAFLESLKERDALLKSMGLESRLWSDAQCDHANPLLNIHVRNNLLDVNRCRDLPLEREVLEALRSATRKAPLTLAALLEASTAHWDQVMSAIAANHISIDLEKKLHETSLIRTPATERTYEHYFSQKPGSSGWWRSLPNLDFDLNNGST